MVMPLEIVKFPYMVTPEVIAFHVPANPVKFTVLAAELAVARKDKP